MRLISPFVLGWIALNLIALGAFIALLWKPRPALAWAPVLGLALVSLPSPFLVIATMGGGWGPGTLFCCLPGLVVPLSLITILLARPRFWRAFPDDRGRRRLFLAGGALIVLLQLLPAVGSQAIRWTCSVLSAGTASRIAEAAQAYQHDHGDYPEDLQALVPNYLPAVPAPACAWLSGREGNAFDIASCGTGPTLIVSPSVDGGGIERFNLETGNWSSISFLDGACSFLR